MFVAYLVPREDFHLVIEDGLGYVEVGATKEEAEAKVRAKFEADEDDQAKRWAALGYDPEPRVVLEDAYVLHSCEA
jgi:hypothetical protein